jgi:transcriptional regulator with XRE-family HTH domain
MPCHKLSNYLRTHRKRIGLSQDEVAFLLGHGSIYAVSIHEHFHRAPQFHTLLAYLVILQQPVHELFAGEYQKVEQAVVRRATHLIGRLSTKSPDQPTARKLAHLRAIIANAGVRV